MSPDWYEIATDPWLRAWGQWLRDSLGLWVGILDREGRSIPIGAGETEVDKPICRRFQSHAIEVDREGERSRVSCRGALREWAEGRPEHEGTSNAHHVTCHAGLSGELMPLVEDEEVIGQLYVSGFVQSNSASRQREHVRELLERHRLTSGMESGEVESIPNLDDRDRQYVISVLECMRDRIEAMRAESSRHDRESPERFEGMIGGTERMQQLFEMIEQVADTDSTVLIEGENGTGKELVARALHRRSRRRDGRFVALNCAALSSELLESELFGHEEGAFSGAHRDRVGLCEEAHRGTLLLDEIGDMAKPMQSRLLRFLQSGEFSPVGSSRRRSADVRLLCATHRDLEERVEQGEFRRDLYFRLNVIRLRVPPLRERKEDIPALIDHFLHRAAARHGLPEPTLTETCRRTLMAHDWPGNVRELEHEIERLVVTHRGGEITSESLGPDVEEDPSSREVIAPSVDSTTLPEARERLERHMILEALRATGWNKTRAADELEISRRTLIRKVSTYGLESEDAREGD